MMKQTLQVWLFKLVTIFAVIELKFEGASASKSKRHQTPIPNAIDEVAVTKLEDYEIEYQTPTPSQPVYFHETFDDISSAQSRWIPSLAKKHDDKGALEYLGQWDFALPKHSLFPNDHALVLRSKAKHAAISVKLDRKFDFTSKPLIVQYEVTFQHGMDCGGAYIKLLSYSKTLNLEEFHDKTPYTIMFGPDKCGNDVKLHFIFRHKNPLNGTFEEKHAKQPSNPGKDAFTDKKPHFYRLLLNPNNQFEIFVDGLLVNQGSLLEDVEPPVNPPMIVEDVNDTKPQDWDEREKIPDENARKPADWDESAPFKIPDPDAKVPSGWLEDEPIMIPDPNSVQPNDWDDKIDGVWEPPSIPNPKCMDAVGCGVWKAPLIENPKFKGKWYAPLVSNPGYKGKWSRRKIPNPNYFEDNEPFKMTPIGAIGLEIWTMTDGVLFDNFIVSDNLAVVNEFTDATYQIKMLALEKDSRGVFERFLAYSNNNPWLYALYTVFLAVFVVIAFSFCFGVSVDQKKMKEANVYDWEEEKKDKDKDS